MDKMDKSAFKERLEHFAAIVRGQSDYAAVLMRLNLSGFFEDNLTHHFFSYPFLKFARSLEDLYLYMYLLCMFVKNKKFLDQISRMKLQVIYTQRHNVGFKVSDYEEYRPDIPVGSKRRFKTAVRCFKRLFELLRQRRLDAQRAARGKAQSHTGDA